MVSYFALSIPALYKTILRAASKEDSILSWLLYFSLKTKQFRRLVNYITEEKGLDFLFYVVSNHAVSKDNNFYEYCTRQNLQAKSYLDSKLNQDFSSTGESDELKTKVQIQALNTLLNEMRLKKDELEGRGEKAAAEVAGNLIENIENELLNTFKEKHPSQAKIQSFQTACQDHIKTATPELGKHRGWRRVLLNVTACVVLLGVGYLIAGAFNCFKNGKFTFFNDTDSQKKLNHLSKEVAEIEDHAVVKGMRGMETS